MRRILLTLSFIASAGSASAQTETAIFAGGCFWCVESDFQDLDGVIEATSGLTGGSKANPSYRSYGDHREAVRIEFDPSIVTYEELVDGFFRSIDPTDDGGQFCDRGFTYTTAIYTTSDEQLRIADRIKSKFDNSGVLPAPIVTEIAAASTFYDVSDYHQDYYKSDDVILTRFGPLTKAKAYKKYRNACGRDATTQKLWGDAAFVAAGL
ncbi:MAG: peptide-methionine (S)-S-oxide reductase MsrA [Pseudomonadota bacterium]